MTDKEIRRDENASLRAEVERLREALGWFLDDERFHVAVGGNPNVVQKMIHDARLIYIGTLTPTCPRCFGRGYTGLSSLTGHCPDCNGRGVLMPSVREIERVAKERDELRAEVERLRAALEAAAKERDELRPEVERLARENDETYEIGKRDGYESAVQDFDLATGGDGEFKGSTIPGETVDVPSMKARVIARFKSAGHIYSTCDAREEA